MRFCNCLPILIRLNTFPEAAHSLCMYLSTRVLSTEAIPSGKEAMEFVIKPAEGSASSPFTSEWKETNGKQASSQFGGIGDTSGLRNKDILLKPELIAYSQNCRAVIQKQEVQSRP